MQGAARFSNVAQDLAITASVNNYGLGASWYNYKKKPNDKDAEALLAVAISFEFKQIAYLHRELLLLAIDEEMAAADKKLNSIVSPKEQQQLDLFA